MKETKWDGVLDITFKNSKGDVFYYDVSINFSRNKVKFTLPRYHPMVGWIEIFGLPPQNEWVFLDNEQKAWHKTTPFNFEVNGMKFKMKETLEVFPDLVNNRRSLELRRTIGKEIETQWYEEDWSKMSSENRITKRSVFKHSGGHYFVDEEMFFNPTLEMLNKKQKSFVENIKKKHGNPSMGIWLKRSKMSGSYPPIYSQLFPFWKKNILNAKCVESVELGYEITQAHGDWYKIIEIAGKVYEIEEDNYTERDEIYKNKKVSIKNTYRKKIREII